MFWVLFLLLSVAAAERDITPSVNYRNYEEMTDFLHWMAAAYPKITRLYSIGKTVNNRDMNVIVISGHTDNPPPELIPKVKYIGNMHGNEAVGRELLLNFIEYLLVNYEDIEDAVIRRFLDSTQVHILPSMNPDGFEAAGPPEMCTGIDGRFNSNGVDLNRNFPAESQQPGDEDRAVETQNVMTWLAEHQFVLSANLHGGAKVVSYPYDNFSPGSHSPDDDLFVAISRNYSSSHANMYLGNADCANFPDGITNGAEWYPLNGGMQDYNYLQAGCVEVTIEVACCKYPADVSRYWSENRAALLNYLLQVNRGIKGLVTDADTGHPIEGAAMTIQGREVFQVRTTSRGEYWRLLLPGTHTIQVEADGYVTQSRRVEVPAYQESQLEVNIRLTK